MEHPMRSIAVALTFLSVGVCADRVDGQVQTFPYQAVVVKDDVLVRSGGNQDYYPTLRLKRDAVVTVHRQDPGGWLAIDPPEGSFSWIPARYVDRATPDADKGVVTEDDIIIFVGSEFGEESSVWQRKLANGTQVQILGEQQIETAAGLRSMYKIAPPFRERRWIAGDAVVAVDETTRHAQDQDPFKLPSRLRQNRSQVEAPVAVQPAPSSRLQRIRQIRLEQRKLVEIDLRFRTMLRDNPAKWDLQSLEAEYNDLRSTATWRPVAGQIDLRFPAIDRYRQRKAQYDDFKRLTSETEQRDAELLASQFGGRKSSEDAATTFPEPLNVAVANPQGSLLDVPGASLDGTGPTVRNGSPVATPGIQPGGRYIGAGIVQRLPDGGYVLTSSSGQKLAQIKGNDSVVLEEFVGKPVGLHGKRWYREDLGSDFIEVTGLEPVRIRQ
jgi:hypothetical protein